MKKVPVYGMTEFFRQTEAKSFYANYLPIHLEEHRFVNSHHRHSTYVSVLFTKGTGVHLIDFASYPVKRGHFFLLNPGQVHSWSLSEDVDGYVFFHTKEFYDSLFLNYKIEDFPFFHYGQNYPMVKLEEDGIQRLEPMFNEIVVEHESKIAYKSLKISLLVNLIYVELSRLYQKELHEASYHASYPKIKQLQRFIDEHYKHLKLASDYADLLNMTTRHLSRICAENLNTTTTDLILNRVLLEAKRMLIHDDSSIQSIANELGYDDYSYFIRIFKKKVGVSPKEFQNRIKNDALNLF